MKHHYTPWYTSRPAFLLAWGIVIFLAVAAYVVKFHPGDVRGIWKVTMAEKR